MVKGVKIVCEIKCEIVLSCVVIANRVILLRLQFTDEPRCGSHLPSSGEGAPRRVASPSNIEASAFRPRFVTSASLGHNVGSAGSCLLWRLAHLLQKIKTRKTLNFQERHLFMPAVGFAGYSVTFI